VAPNVLSHNAVAKFVKVVIANAEREVQAERHEEVRKEQQEHVVVDRKSKLSNKRLWLSIGQISRNIMKVSGDKNRHRTLRPGRHRQRYPRSSAGPRK
jgi:hypothetical protein